MNTDIFKRNNIHILGDEGNQTIIFAHGFGSDQSAWRHHAELFARDHRVILFDHVGSGKSDPAAYSPYRYSSIQSYAEDLIDICNTLHLSDVILVGHSVSGMVSVLASIRKPNLFKRLVFVGASPRYLNDEGYTGGFEQSDLDNLFAAMSSNYHAWVAGFAPVAMRNPERPELAIEFASTLDAIRPDIAQAVARFIFQSDYRSELPRLRTKTLIIQSNDDIAVPMEVGRYMSEKIAGSHLLNVKAHGHLPHLSAPDEITEALQSFLSE